MKVAVEQGSDDPLPAYRVRRSDRARRARLTLTDLGEAVVVLPRRAPAHVAAMLVEEHADWIARHRSRLLQERAVLTARPSLGQGRVLEVGGEPYRVAEVDGGPGRRPPRGHVEVSPGRLIVRLGADGRGMADLLEAWLRRRAREGIEACVERRAQELGVRAGRIRIADQSSRWASASVHGTLSFSWRLIIAPPYVLDAVVVHELAHLLIRGHGRAFWSLVERHAPSTPEARRWLRAHARELRAALEP